MSAGYICTCECHNNPEYKHEGHCCFKCPKCHELIVLHFYNEHVHNCSKANRLAKRIQKERQLSEPLNKESTTRKPKTRLVNVTFLGSTRSRHRKPTRR